MAKPVRVVHRHKARPAAPKAAQQIEMIRQAVADYMHSEGCDCCRDAEAHTKHEARLGELLGVPKYPDGYGYDFSKFRSSVSNQLAPREK